MKKFINIVLLLGTIISVGVALKYSALPIPIFFAEEWKEFWITTPEEQQKYVLLYDFAVGFILSALFYFVVEEIPERIKLHKAKHLLKTHINQLLRHMEELISIVIQKYSINTKLKELTKKDFLILDGEVHITTEEISYLTKEYYNKTQKEKISTHQYGTINDLVKRNLKGIFDKTNDIKNYEYFYATDGALVECIRNIETCSLMRYYLPNAEKNKNNNCFLLHGTSAAMNEFTNLYLKLSKLKYNTEYTVTTLDSNEETEKYRSERDSGALLQSVFDKQNERRNLALTNPIAVVSGEKYNTTVFVSQMKRRLNATYISWENAQEETLDKFKYIILILDSEIKKIDYHFLESLDLQKKVILLTEQNMFWVRHKNKVASFGIKVIEEIFFKSSFKISPLPVIFNKEEPSEKNIVNIVSQIETIVFGKHW